MTTQKSIQVSLLHMQDWRNYFSYFPITFKSIYIYINFFYFTFFSIIIFPWYPALTWSVWCCLLPSRMSCKGKRWSVIHVCVLLCTSFAVSNSIPKQTDKRVNKCAPDFDEPDIQTWLLSIYRWNERDGIFRSFLVAKCKLIALISGNIMHLCMR